MAMPSIDKELMFFCAGIKAYEGKTNRDTISALELIFGPEQWAEIGFHYNRFSDFLNDSNTTRLLNWAIAEVCSPLMPFAEDIVLDGTGISLTSRGTYRSERYGIDNPDDRALYMRLHLAMDRRFKVFPGAIVTRDHGKGAGETTQTPELLRRLKTLGYRPRRVLADKLYAGEPVLEAIEDFGAEAVIPLKVTYLNKLEPKTPLMRRLRTQFLADPDAFHEKYRFRPLVEAGISALKRKFSESIRARSFRGQVNEVLFKVLCHNMDCLIHAGYEQSLNLESMLGDPGRFSR